MSRPSPHMRWAPLVTGALLVCIPPGSASAHTGFVESQPSDGQTLREPPRTVSVSFSEPPLPTGAAMVALGPQGRIPLPASTRGRSIEAPWPSESVNGAYTLTYRVVAADGHPITGEVSFRIAAPRAAGESARPSAPQQTAAPQTAEKDTEPGPSVPVWLWLVAVALIGAGAYLAVARGRRGE